MLGVLLVAGLLAVAPGATATAEARATSTRANDCAQHRPECPPTPWPTATATSQPTATPTATLVVVIDTPTVAPALLPEPCWLTDQDLGDPDNSYIVFAEDGTPVPCPLEDQPLPDDEPTPDAEPRAVSVETPTPVRPVQAPATVASRPVAAVATPQIVYVYVQPTPTDSATPTPTHTATSTQTPPPTRTPVPTRATAAFPIAFADDSTAAPLAPYQMTPELRHADPPIPPRRRFHPLVLPFHEALSETTVTGDSIAR